MLFSMSRVARSSFVTLVSKIVKGTLIAMLFLELAKHGLTTLVVTKLFINGKVMSISDKLASLEPSVIVLFIYSRRK